MRTNVSTRNALKMGGVASRMLEKSYIKFRARVGTNNFNWAVGGTPGTYRTSGIVLTDVQNAQLKDNYFLQCKPAGIKGTGNLTNTKFYCNTFEECFNGLEFDNATLSNQGDAAHGAGNQWINCTNYNYEITNPVSSNTAYYYRNTGNENPNLGVGLFNSLNADWISTSAPGLISPCSALNKTDESLDEITKNETQITIYPNPSNGLVSIEYKGSVKEIYSVYIFNIDGALLYSDTSKEYKKVIDISSLPSGIYIFKIYGFQSIEFKKVIKQ